MHPLHGNRPQSLTQPRRIQTPGQLDPNLFQLDKDSSILSVEGTGVHNAFKTMVDHVNQLNARYGVLTDETFILVVENCRASGKSHVLSMRHLPDTKNPKNPRGALRYLLSMLMYDELDACHLTGKLGLPAKLPTAARRRYPGTLAVTDSNSHKWICDWDFSALALPGMWKHFVSWHQRIQKEALSEHCIDAGTRILCDLDTTSFENQFGALKCPHDYHISQGEIEEMFNGWTPRPRNSVLDERIGLRQRISITIQSTVRSGPERYSRVYFGQVDGFEESFCIKLFDERCFGIPKDAKPSGLGFADIYEPGLDGLQKSEDLAIREKSVYGRLSCLQGTLLPHCYGLFQVCPKSHPSSLDSHTDHRVPVHAPKWMEMLGSSTGTDIRAYPLSISRYRSS